MAIIILGNNSDEVGAQLEELTKRVLAAKGCRNVVLNRVGSGGQVCHFPPGTSKWNKIEHRLFCFITKNWRGRPQVSYEVIVNLIANTTSASGLIVKAALDTGHYETGIAVTNEELARVKITPAKFHGEWNYIIRPAR